MIRELFTSRKSGTPNGFAVDDVSPNRQALPTLTLRKSVEWRFQRCVHHVAQAEELVLETPRVHPLIGAVHGAFAEHYPLILSPDCIWLTITQGFSHHVTENSESLRATLVRHEGKRNLHEVVFDLTAESLARAVAGFSAQIRDASNPVLHDALICDFSSTTPAIRTASQIVLMDAYSNYFNYMVGCVCGIPRVELTGTVEDWQKMRTRVEVLAAWDLEWWVQRLRPILDEFVLAAQGHPTTEFWQAICKPRASYGESTITGWIADLFPYLGEPGRRRRNNIFKYTREAWIIPVEGGVPTFGGDPGAHMGPSVASFPSGLASVPVQVSLPAMLAAEPINMDLVGGFFGVQQRGGDCALTPVISWAITEPAPKTPVCVPG